MPRTLQVEQFYGAARACSWERAASKSQLDVEEHVRRIGKLLIAGSPSRSRSVDRPRVGVRAVPAS